MSGSKSSPLSDAAARTEPLAFTVHSMPEPALDEHARQRSGRFKMLLILLVCAAPVLASYFMYYVVKPSGEGTAYSRLILPPRPLPDVAGRTPQLQTVALPGLRGQWLLVVVGGGACDAECEKRLYLQRQLREMTGRERDRIDKVWLVTDDAPIAPALVQALQATPAMHILRVPKATVESWLQPEPDHTLEQHLYIVDPRGEWMMRAPAGPDPAKLKRDLDRLLRAAASWDRPGR